MERETVAADVVDTPVGPLGVAATELGLVAVSFGRAVDIATVAPRLRLYAVDDDARLDEVRRQLGEYFSGGRRAFDLPLDWSLAEGFTREVLTALCEAAPFGRTVTYGQLAARVGQPEAAQAVGMAMGANPLPVVVPCHRVLSRTGLGGFGGGLERKRWLLTHEGILQPTLDWA